MCPFKHENIKYVLDESVEDESDEIIEDDSDEEEELDYEKYFISDNISELDMHPFISQ